MSKKQAEEQMSENTESTIETTDQGETIGNANDARLAMLNQINDTNDEVLADDFVEYDEAGQVVKFAPKIEEEALTTGDDEVATTELQRMAEEANSDASKETKQKFKIKVNGKEMLLTEEELLARAQKVEAADVYLAEAARMRKEALDQRNQQPVYQQPQVPQQDLEAQRIEELRATARAIQMGTEEEAIQAIAKLQSRPSITVADMTKTVDDRLSFKQAVSRFQTEYQDILADPVLRDIAVQRDQAALQQGDTRDYWTRFEQIGNELRSWKASLAPAATTPPPAVAPEKQARKASTPAVPKVASTKAPAPVDEDDSEESPADVIRAIAKSRGGPQWMRG